MESSIPGWARPVRSFASSRLRASWALSDAVWSSSKTSSIIALLSAEFLTSPTLGRGVAAGYTKRNEVVRATRRMGPMSPKDHAEMDLKILSWNIHKGIGGLDRRYDLNRVARVISELAP